MEEAAIINELFDNKIISVLNVFLDDKQEEFYLREVSKRSGVAVASTFRIVNKLVKLEIIDVIMIKKIKLYKIADNKNVDYLEKFLRQKKKVLDIIVDKIKDVEGITQIILQGKDTDTKANLLLIGERIEDNNIRSIIDMARQEHNFTLSSLSLSPQQYENMVSMGLYSGQKKILFNKF